MRAGLARLDAGLPRNPHVRITSRRGGWITVPPLRARPDPESINAVKAEVTADWPMTSLLDMVKEADLRLGFTDALGSPTAYETLDRADPAAAAAAVPLWPRHQHRVAAPRHGPRRRPELP